MGVVIFVIAVIGFAYVICQGMDAVSLPSQRQRVWWRREQLARVAARLGLEFQPSAFDREAGFLSFSRAKATWGELAAAVAPFQQGLSVCTVNSSSFKRWKGGEMIYTMRGTLNDSPVVIVGYSYPFGGHNTQFYEAAVVAFQINTPLPEFRLEPGRRWFSRGVHFEKWPGFSKNYKLTTVSEFAAREIFNDRLLTFYESRQPSFTTAAADGWLLIYRDRKDHCFDPEEIPPILEEAVEVLELFKNEMNSRSPSGPCYTDLDFA